MVIGIPIFFTNANNRKRHCSIIRIKDVSGVWLEELHVIRQKFIDDFSDRFTSTRRSLSAFNFTLASPVITAEENFELIKPVTEDDTYSAVFQMDLHKAPSDGFGASFF